MKTVFSVIGILLLLTGGLKTIHWHYTRNFYTVQREKHDTIDEKLIQSWQKDGSSRKKAEEMVATWRRKPSTQRTMAEKEASLQSMQESVVWCLFTAILLFMIGGVLVICGAIESKRAPTKKVCPYCLEKVKAAARVCGHCGYKFDNNDVPTKLKQSTDLKDKDVISQEDSEKAKSGLLETSQD